MGNILQRLGILFSPRIDERRNRSIEIHHKCRNCGQVCDPSSSTTGCAFEKFTRTGTKDQPTVIRPAVPNDRVRWSMSFHNYEPIEFTSAKIQTSTKEYVDRDPRHDLTVDIPWNTNDRLCDRRSYHGQYPIVGRVPRNPCGRTGITGRGHLGNSQ